MKVQHATVAYFLFSIQVWLQNRQITGTSCSAGFRRRTGAADVVHGASGPFAVSENMELWSDRTYRLTGVSSTFGSGDDLYKFPHRMHNAFSFTVNMVPADVFLVSTLPLPFSFWHCPTERMWPQQRKKMSKRTFDVGRYTMTAEMMDWKTSRVKMAGRSHLML